MSRCVEILAAVDANLPWVRSLNPSWTVSGRETRVVVRGERKVLRIKDFGAFVEIAPETDGLCHVSELSDQYVGRVDDVVKMGDEIKVKVLLIDDQGRIKLSRKAAMAELGEKDPERPRPERGPRDEGDHGERPPSSSGGGRSRGPRRDGRE